MGPGSQLLFSSTEGTCAGSMGDGRPPNAAAAARRKPDLGLSFSLVSEPADAKQSDARIEKKRVSDGCR